MPRKSKNNLDLFSYVCGSFTIKAQRRSITPDLKQIYKLYFGCPSGDQDKQRAPYQICTSCSSGLQNWLNKRTSAMPFAIPMIWREPKDHFQDCYFSLVNAKGFCSKHRKKITYPKIDSVLGPVPYDPSMPAPLPPEDGLASLADKVVLDEDSNLAPSDSTSLEYEPEEKLKPILFSQKQLNDLVKDQALSKQNSELLASPLQENNQLQKVVLVSH